MESVAEFVYKLNLSEQDTQTLLTLTPANYTGLAPKLSEQSNGIIGIYNNKAEVINYIYDGRSSYNTEVRCCWYLYVDNSCIYIKT